MNQINSNLKTLAMLCVNPGVNWTQGVANYTTFLTLNANNGTGQNIIYPSSFLTFILKNFNSALATQAAYLYNQIIYLFAHAIPYNQTTQNYAFTQGDVTVNYTIPDVFYDIDAYMTMYQNRVLQYLTNSLKFTSQIKAMNSGYTNTYQYNTNSGSGSQNNNYDVNSFNPVETTATLEVNPIGVNIGNYNNGISTPFTVPNGSPAITINGATYNNHGAASASNSSQWAANNALNLQNYASVGESNGMSILRPLIKKISSLFWSLGNDYYPDSINWGFNIW